MKDTTSSFAIVMVLKRAFTMLLVAVCPLLLLAQAPVFTQTVVTGTTLVSITDLEHRAPVNQTTHE